MCLQTLTYLKQTPCSVQAPTRPTTPCYALIEGNRSNNVTASTPPIGGLPFKAKKLLKTNGFAFPICVHLRSSAANMVFPPPRFTTSFWNRSAHQLNLCLYARLQGILLL